MSAKTPNAPAAKTTTAANISSTVTRLGPPVLLCTAAAGTAGLEVSNDSVLTELDGVGVAELAVGELVFGALEVAELEVVAVVLGAAELTLGVLLGTLAGTLTALLGCGVFFFTGTGAFCCFCSG
ncbi:hypothetical protein FHU41_002551 [Psychromicrobium silvestre]|uniref:Uncharacterized protein n=1 Tax=Psychromicrobium silvestre TaxID=1645614 RepID=A0A7Y9LVE7_9MICC|nr:hypothetical protein [Psychromicrobium silvestre]NYE96301.1 hypothetical protein [Psychromicrobium silvestre]